MAPDQTRPTDTGDRRRAVEDARASFIVEASAGTGKTRTLIDRVLHLVLEEGPDGPPLRIGQICAITFTEKAAGEMKLRLRQQFQRALSQPGQERRDRERRERARQALYDLESASISTFHSFAVSLLKERPVEAGIDPRFAALDEIQSELFFREAWEAWIGRALRERRPALEEALRGGFRLETLEGLARTLRSRWLTVRDLPADTAPSDAEILEEAAGLLGEGEKYRLLLLGHEDKLAARLEDALAWLEAPERDSAGVRMPGSAGAAANWSGGKETVGQVREFLRRVAAFCDHFERLPLERLLCGAVAWIREEFMAGEWEARKRSRGLLDFDDQLRLACGLLRENSSVRRACLAEYRTLLVDEFQDTDSVQWRIVLLLTSTDADEKDFGRLRPGPGRLFIVGDPKQSIYRFRNADIETYLRIVRQESLRSLGLERLQLSTNFRSVPSILEFVDAAFCRAMRAEGGSGPAPGGAGRFQQDYLAFGGNGHRPAASPAPAVHLLGDAPDGDGTRRRSREFLELESHRVAALVRSVCGSGDWAVQDPAGPEGALRPPRWGDIAILLPVLTHAGVLEDALRDRGVPYVLEGGKFYYARSEVASAITVLRSVANPNDRVSLYGALRSVFFGLSDEDLLEARAGGQALDYRVPAPDGSPLRGPFAILRELHLGRHGRRASETFEMLLDRTGAREVLAGSGLQSLANLGKLGRTLRALQGQATFSQVVGLLGTMDQERMAESESRLMEERSDAVRVMSVHKAKGLDFPIVILAALGVQKRGRTDDILADPHNRKVFAVRIVTKEGPVATRSWEELAEEDKDKEEAELVRLLYVAATRARDHMVVSTHTAGWKRIGGTDLWAPDVGPTRLKPLGPLLEECLEAGGGLVRLIDLERLPAAAAGGRDNAAPAPDIFSEIEREYAGLRAWREAAAAASGGGPGGAGPTKADPAPGRARRLGTALHAALEQADLLERRRRDWADGIATEYALDPESRRMFHAMLEASLSSELVGRAAAALRAGRRVFREFPFVRPLGDGSVEEGKIDLLFEDGDGWVLVDYKTDRVDGALPDEGVLKEKYAAQIRGYADALRDLSVEVSEAYVLLARTGRAVPMIPS